MRKTKRVKIVTGLRCNIKCIFCYYRDSLSAPNKSFSEVVKDIKFAIRHGIEEVDFSGGEPTVHPDLPRMIRAAKELGIKKVCIITNGIRLSNPSYVRTLREHGLDEVLFSLHGGEARIHEELTATNGSFKKILTAMENAKKCNLKIRTNTVVNKLNYAQLANLSNLIQDYSPLQVNFIVLNDWCFAKHLVEKLLVKYSVLNSYLKEACLILKDSVRYVNVRYIPFCFMSEFEEFVCNHLQVMYDPFEWVPRVRSALEAQNNLVRYLAILTYGFIFGKTYKKLFRVSMEDLLDECVVRAIRKRFYVKDRACQDCMFDEICDGLERTYADYFGFEELSPVKGERITEPYFFRRHYML